MFAVWFGHVTGFETEIQGDACVKGVFLACHSNRSIYKIFSLMICHTAKTLQYIVL